MNLCFRILAACWLTAACIGQAAASAPTLTSVANVPDAVRPPLVPLNYVVTPHGFFHPSCVIEVGEGEELAVNGAVLRQRDGVVVRNVEPCHHPRYDAKGQGRTHAPAMFNGPVASANSNPDWTPPARQMQATFTVPGNPKSLGNQVIFLYPGLETTLTANSTLMQPVLAWNGFTDNAWTVTNWNCCRDGNVSHGTTIKAQVGHTIRTSMTGDECAGNTCKKWKITSLNKTTGDKTIFKTKSYGQAFNWYFGGVLDAYFLDTCSQYPSTGEAFFYDIHIYDMNNAEVTPGDWYTTIATGAPPCDYRVSPTQHTVTLTWRTTP